jgi:hypothetical protein
LDSPLVGLPIYDEAPVAEVFQVGQEVYASAFVGSVN